MHLNNCLSYFMLSEKSKTPYLTVVFFILYITIIPRLAYSDTVSIQDDSESIPIYCEADYLEYAKEKKLIQGNGNVKIEYRDINIYADYLRVDFNQEEILANGNVSFVSRTGNILGDSISYNLKTRSGLVKNASTDFEPMYYRGKEIEKISDDEFRVRNGLATTCDLVKPHYRFQASRINIYPNERLVAINVALYVGSIPVFYLPILTFPLKGGKISRFIPTIGYSAAKGWYVNAGYNYSIGRFTDANIFAEYMERKGFGIGTEMEQKSSKWNGASSLYYLREGEKDRYKINLKAQPEKSNSFAYLYMLSDNDYDKEFGSYFGSPDNWTRRKLTAFVSYNKNFAESLNFQADLKREVSKEAIFTSLPLISLYSTPFKTGNLPLYLDWSTSFGNNYRVDSAGETTEVINEDGYLFSNNWLNYTPNPVPVNKKLNIVSGVDLQALYHSQQWSGGISNFYPGYKAKAGPRYRLNSYFTGEVTYNLDSEIQTDTSISMPGTVHYLRGIFIYDNRMFNIELTGNYHLLEDAWVWDKFKNARLDITINPEGKVRFYSGTKYHVYEKTSQNLSYVQIMLNNLNMRFGNQYYYGTYPELYLTSEFDFTKVVTFLGTYRTIISSNYEVLGSTGTGFKDIDCVLIRDLHCWEASITYRILRKEIRFDIGIKAFPSARVGFYPSSIF